MGITRRSANGARAATKTLARTSAPAAAPGSALSGFRLAARTDRQGKVRQRLVDNDGAELVRQHNERLDGSGYPAGLRGKEILPEVRESGVHERTIHERPSAHRASRTGGRGVLDGDLRAGAGDVEPALGRFVYVRRHLRPPGEEFCFLLAEAGRDEAGAVAERLRAAIAALRFDAGTLAFSMTASLGVSELRGNADTLESLLLRSDEALYEAKAGGRDRVIAR
jgi:hypothetical protein